MGSTLAFPVLNCHFFFFVRELFGLLAMLAPHDMNFLATITNYQFNFSVQLRLILKKQKKIPCTKKRENPIYNFYFVKNLKKKNQE